MKTDLKPSPNRPVFGDGRFRGPEHFEQCNREVGCIVECRQLRRGDFLLEFSNVMQNGISITRERFNISCEINAEPPEGEFGFVIPRSGDSIEIGNCPFEPGHVVLFPSRSEMNFRNRGPASDYAIHLAEKEFVRAARYMFPQAELTKSGICELVKGDPDRLNSLVDQLRKIETSANSDESEILYRIVNQAICWLADAAEVTDVRFLANSAGDVIARRAQEYIEANYRDPIDMAVLCREVGAGVRSVQRSFAKHLQMSPLAYLTVKRLDAARRELLESRPSEKSVSEIAVDHGFTHLGRFSVLYREHFGESPRETLHKRG